MHCYFARVATVYAADSKGGSGLGIDRPITHYPDEGRGEMRWVIGAKQLFTCFHETYDELLVERGLIKEDETLGYRLSVEASEELFG